MASTASTAGDQPVCPDPSVHEKHDRLASAASTAALLATQANRESQTPSSGRESVLDADGRLSSKSAATSLKYAKAQDLPSFPTRGVQMDSAGAAAYLAKDYKMKELWQPEEMSQAGSRAAIQAHHHGGKVDLWQPEASSAGNSAAVLAMRNTGLSPQIDRGYTDTGRNNSMLAAAMSATQGRQRAGSTPAPPPAAYPDSRNSAQNAASAAAISHRASVRARPAASQDGWNSEANQAARVTHIGSHMKPEMFGDRPPVEMEVEEQRHNAALRASAVSMAKTMYAYKEEQRHASEAAEAGAGSAHRRNPSLPAQPDLRQEALQYIHLQDAAHKLAQERLAKIDKDSEAKQYREYWGGSTTENKSTRRFSTRGRRRRAASDSRRDTQDLDDENAARRIRQQMSQLSTGLNTVDDKKRDDDRARLLAAAEKRVHDRLHDMDEKVFQETGKVSPAMMEEWEAKARAKAEQNRAERDLHPGQTHIGGGKFMSQAEIEAIAAARLQSTFDEINDTAAKRRARDEEIERRRDLRQTELMNEKMQADEQKEEFRRMREADKAAARKEKDDRKAADKAKKEAQKPVLEERKAAIKAQKEEGLAIMQEDQKDDEQRAKDAEKAAAKQEKEEHKAIIAERKEAIKAQKGAGEAIMAEDLRKSREHKREEAAAVAGAAALAEIAERARTYPEDIPAEDVQSKEAKPKAIVIKEPETKDTPTKEAQLETKNKRASVFGRIANKLKKRDEGEKQDATAAEEAKDGDKSDVGTGSAVAAAFGLAGGAGLARALEEKRDSADEDTTVPAQASAVPAVEVTEPVESEATDPEDGDELLKPTVSRTYTEPLSSPGVAMARPDLERHISTIQHSDDEDHGAFEEDDEDWDSNSEPEQDADVEDVDDHEPVSPLSEEEQHDSRGLATAAGIGAAAATTAGFVAVEDHSATQEPTSEKSDVVGLTDVKTAAAYSTTPAPVKNAAVVTAPEAPAEQPIASTEPATEAPAVEAPPADGVVGLTDVKTAAAYSTTPAPVKGAPSTSTEAASTPAVAGSAAAADDTKDTASRTATVPKGVVGLTDVKTAAAVSTTPTPVAKNASESKGIKGFFGKLRKGKSKPESKPTASASTPKSVGAAPAAAPAAAAVVDDGGRSTSSFQRHAEDPRDLDDVSSSGADEEDMTRGRTGYVHRSRDDEPVSPISGAGDDDQFEEARDHFDEGLAPEPAFAGQLKSASPVRETHFREEL